jgi:signal peptidase I
MVVGARLTAFLRATEAGERQGKGMLEAEGGGAGEKGDGEAGAAMKMVGSKAGSKAKKGLLASLLTGFFELARVVALAIVVAMFIRIFLFQPFNIPSGSMKPTLLVGDYLFISKFSYGYSRFSFPFAPRLFSGRLLFSPPHRGDVVVFHYKDTDYIKRLIGLPGDRVQVKRGLLFVNGEVVARRKIEPFPDDGHFGHRRKIRRFRETLPGGPSYETLDLLDGPGDNTRLYVVPDGHYFMMGDNRDNSSDSRFFSPIGFVPEENLIGKALFLYYSHASGGRGGGWASMFRNVRWGRVFSPIH